MDLVSYSILGGVLFVSFAIQVYGDLFFWSYVINNPYKRAGPLLKLFKSKWSLFYLLKILQNGLKDVFDEAILATFEKIDDGLKRRCSLL